MGWHILYVVDMIKFAYRTDTGEYPHFVPVCAKCNVPVLDIHTANLETRDGDLFLFHFDCALPDQPGPWCRWAEVLFWLLPDTWRRATWKVYKNERDPRYRIFG